MCIRRAVAILKVLLAVAFLGQGAAAAEYRIGAQDKIRIKVHEWPALSDDMSVSAEGTLSLPIIGTINVAGKTVPEVADEIANRLRTRSKLPERPFASVEILQFRPFYIVGDVQRPGDYPYRPRMTVLMALSIAGGPYRSPEAAPLRIGRDIIASQANIVMLENKKWELRLKKSRLEAELKGSKSFTVGRDLAYPASIEDDELAIMRARTMAFDAQVAGFRDQIRLAQEEIKILDARAKTIMRQQASAEKEADGLRRLGEKGLSLTYREELLERLTAKIEGDQREIDVLVTRARQTISQAESFIAKLISERERDIRTEIRQVSAQLAEIDEQVRLQHDLVAEAQSFGAANQLVRIDRNRAHLRFRIARTIEGGTSEFAVGQNDFVNPGDVVVVEQVIGDPGQQDASTGAVAIQSLVGAPLK